jgi:hypothetical protein
MHYLVQRIAHVTIDAIWFFDVLDMYFNPYRTFSGTSCEKQ